LARKGVFYLAVTGLLFSTYEVVSKIIADGVNPFQINFLRFFFGGLFLLVPALRELRKNGNLELNGGNEANKQSSGILELKDLLSMLFLGILNIGVSMNLLQLGINYTRASIAAVVFSSNPLFVAIAAVLILRETLSASKIIGLLLGFGGVVLTFVGDRFGDGSFYQGIFFLVLSAMTFGIYTVLAKRITLRVGSLVMNFFSFILGSLALLPFLLVLHIPVFSFDFRFWLHIVYLGFFVTGVGYYAYFVGLSQVDTSLGSMIFFVKPILASVLAAVVLHEEITVKLLVGIFLVLLGVYLVQRAAFSGEKG